MAISPHPTDQEYKTYGKTRVSLHGHYSLEELEEIIERIKEVKRRQEEHLKQSMGTSSQKPE